MLVQSVYLTLNAIAGVSDSVLHAALFFCVVPSLLAAAGLAIGGLMLLEDDDDVGYTGELLLILSPWRSVVSLYYDSKTDGEEIDGCKVCSAVVKYCLSDLPLGIICLYVLAEHGYNIACILKAIQAFTTLLVFFLTRFITERCFGGGDDGAGRQAASTVVMAV